MTKTTFIAFAALVVFSAPASFAVAPAIPLNDDFYHASDLIPSTYTEDGSAATAQPGEPDHFTFGGSTKPAHSLWWKFVPTTSCYVQIDTAGSGYDTVMAVYTGNTLPTLVRIAQDDDSGHLLSTHASLIRFVAKKGVTYHVAVDGFSADQTGITQIRLTYLHFFQPRTYQAALFGGSQRQDDGLLSFTTTTTPVVTGTLRLGASTFPFTGAVNTAGHLIVSVNRPNLSAVSIDLSVGAVGTSSQYGSATGTVLVGDNAYSVTANPAIPYNAAHPCPRAGRLAQAIQNTGAVGFGVSNSIVGINGVVTTVGTLADGTPFAFTAPVLDNSGSTDGNIGTKGNYCYHLPLYANVGQITGTAEFDATATPTSVSGSLQWFRPAPKAGVAYLPQGINGSVINTFGNRYTPPPPTHRVDSVFDNAPTGSSGHAVLEVSSLDYPALTKSDLFLNTSNMFSYGAANPNQVNLKVSTDTGVMVGSLKLLSPTPGGVNTLSTVRGVVIDFPTYTRQFYGFATGITGSSTLLVHP